MILGYKNSNSAAMHFQSNKLDSSNCLNISLRVLSATECKLFIKTTIGDSTLVPDDILTEIAINSQGNIAYIEQVLDYLFERKRNPCRFGLH